MTEPNGAATVSPRPLVRLPSTGFEAKGVVMTAEEIEDTRKRAVTGAGVYTGPTLEYWKKKV